MQVLYKVKELVRRISWKVWVILLVLAVLLPIILGIWPSFQTELELAKSKPVKIMKMQVQTEPLTLEYLGTVNAVDVKKYSFKAAGVVSDILVTKGQTVAEGEVLARLDAKDLGLAAEAARNTRDNAKIAYDFSQDNYLKISKLLEAGAISLQEADRAKVEMENLRALYNNAQIDYQSKQNSLEDTILKADLAGYIGDVLYKEGEIAPAGYPVVVIRGEKLEITAGLTQNDWGKVCVGMGARIAVLDRQIVGRVTSVGQLPDTQTRTYPATIEINEESLPVGIAARVYFDIGEEKGMFVPISAISNDGEDFLYVLDSELKVHRKTVKLGRIKGTDVLLEGLVEGDSIIKEGINRLRDGDKVVIQD